MSRDCTATTVYGCAAVNGSVEESCVVIGESNSEDVPAKVTGLVEGSYRRV